MTKCPKPPLAWWMLSAVSAVGRVCRESPCPHKFSSAKNRSGLEEGVSLLVVATLRAPYSLTNCCSLHPTVWSPHALCGLLPGIPAHKHALSALSGKSALNEVRGRLILPLDVFIIVVVYSVCLPLDLDFHSSAASVDKK